METAWHVLIVVVVLARALLFTPYEAFLEGAIASVMVTAVLAGFLMHQRRDVFFTYSPTSDGPQAELSFWSRTFWP